MPYPTSVLAYLLSKSDILISQIALQLLVYNIIMASLSALFEKRSKSQPKQSALGGLFQKESTQKYQQLAEETNPLPVVLKPEPKKDEPEDLESTIFVGNVPLNYTNKDLRKIFAQYGKINKIWFRSVPVEQNKLGKKANYVLKKFQEGADSMNAYVKFQQTNSAEQACVVNGRVVDGHTLRVSLCLDDNLDYQTTIFVGNLPLDVKQEELRQHFASLGPIVNVRVIKDKYTFKGIGIGYVRFQDKQDMWSALKNMNGTQLQNRPLRVKRAVQKEKLEKKFRKVAEKKLNKKGYTPPQNKKWQSKGKSFRKNEGREAMPQQQAEDKSKARKFHFKRKMIKK